jgi:phosphatidate phosphatase APP1
MLNLPLPSVCAAFLLLSSLSSSLNRAKFRGYFTGRVAHDEEVILFPTLAHSLNSTHWNVPIHGWIYEPEHSDAKRKVFLTVLRRVLSLTPHEQRNDVLQRRMRPFLVDNERWKSPVVRVLNVDYRPPRSTKNGHFQGNVVVSTDDLSLLKNDDDENENMNWMLPLTVTSEEGRVFASHAHLIPSTGVSVISDIDDTIKISNVGDTKQLLKKSFLEEFQAVPGMARLYQQLKKSGATFHFVSSSPYQLYTELESFRRQQNFPPATYHLKTIRPKDKSLLTLFADPVVTKTAAIESIMEKFPNRKYILVGDSGEKDPEVYGAFARRYPDRVVAIWIRNVGWKSKECPRAGNSTSTGQIHDVDNADASMKALPHQTFEDRINAAFDEIPTNKWLLFDEPTELKDFKLNDI